MSRKNPQTPPPDNALNGALFVPILIFGGAIVIALLVLLFGDSFSGTGESAPTRASSGALLDEQTMQRFTSEWDELGLAIGSADAPVVVREFADYQCPACKAFEPIAEKLREKYVDTGQVRFIFFNFPLAIHSHSREAAAAARCAARQQAYWRYEKKLFTSQKRWSGADDPTQQFLNLAVESEIELEPFKRCLQQGATDTLVTKNAKIARTIGVASTPTVLVGRRVFTGVTPFETLTEEIENQLAATNPTPPSTNSP
ncbi:MAG: DsbA family protein [Salinisphaera sp.]|nr:DsbA family protein [Salinisphaera sp.]